ncbi:nitroreductase family protein [Paenibacillus solisilvae]|uniref:Nitroreductase family protein n=1 Tax=Paenibacillus solisilvae TaxID=2486751 RepID=A0ABW0VPY5_9BACL
MTRNTDNNSKSLPQVIEGRRSIRKLTDSPKVTKEQIEEIIRLALHAPSAFNMQSGRLVVLLGDQHKQLWSIVTETLRARVPADKFAATEERMHGFSSGAGTVLFFEDQTTVKETQAKSPPSYQMHFEAWSQQGSAILQYAVWLALTDHGLGASLQHYNPIIDEEIKRKWDIPQNWSLVAQMPFGQPNETPGPRTYLPYEQVVKWHS